MILICGLPCSGNHMIRAHVRRAARLARVEREVIVWHGDPSRIERAEETDSLQIVVPVRNPRCRRESMRLHGIAEGNYPERQTRYAVCQLVARTGADVKMVSYEALVADPVGTGGDLLEWLGLPSVYWDVYDANRKYQAIRQDPP